MRYIDYFILRELHQKQISRDKEKWKKEAYVEIQLLLLHSQKTFFNNEMDNKLFCPSSRDSNQEILKP